MTVKTHNPEALRKLIGSKLKEARELAGLSQGAAGEHLELTHAAVGSYERGRLSVSIDLLLRFSKLYNKPISFFVEEDTEVLKKFEDESQKKQTVFYDLLDNITFSLETSIKHYLKFHNFKGDVDKKVDEVYKILDKDIK